MALDIPNLPYEWNTYRNIFVIWISTCSIHPDIWLGYPTSLKGKKTVQVLECGCIFQVDVRFSAWIAISIKGHALRIQDIQVFPKEGIIPKILLFSDGIGTQKTPVRTGGVDRSLRDDGMFNPKFMHCYNGANPSKLPYHFLKSSLVPTKWVPLMIPVY